MTERNTVFIPAKNKRVIFFLILLSLVFVNWLPIGLSQPLQEVKIGVLAKRGPEIALKKWSATADYLSQALPGYRFQIAALDFTEIHTAVQEGTIDFVLANSAFYVELEKLYGVKRIVTLLNQDSSGRQTTMFGGVILARSDREDIRDIWDLKGKKFMAVEQRSFGGWIMCWRELYQMGIDPKNFFSSLQFGQTHDAVVDAVRRGDVDAGTVRTDTLERMAEGNIIDLDDYQLNSYSKCITFVGICNQDTFE